MFRAQAIPFLARAGAAILLLPAGALAETRSRPIAVHDLCVTRGAVEHLPEGMLRIRDPKVRAVMANQISRDLEMQFTYRGPTQGEAHLGSGELRRQLGLKLRAQDGCNLVYVMWRIAPESKLAVQVKRNPGMMRHIT